MLMVFAVLILVAWMVMRITPCMLKRGTWMNPLMILLVLFIDSYKSYADAIERVGGDEPNSDANAKPWSRETFQAAFIGWPPPADVACERGFQFLKKVLIYWGVVSFGLYFTFLTD